MNGKICAKVLSQYCPDGGADSLSRAMRQSSTTNHRTPSAEGVCSALRPLALRVRHAPASRFPSPHSRSEWRGGGRGGGGFRWGRANQTKKKRTPPPPPSPPPPPLASLAGGGTEQASRPVSHLWAAGAVVAIVCLFACVAAAAAASIPPPGAASCTGCHAASAKIETNVPRIAGRGAAEIVAAMKAFRSGQKPATVMDRIAKGI